MKEKYKEKKIKVNPYKDISEYKKCMREFIEYRNRFKKICVHPSNEDCSNQKIHAHTISQKSVLELIAKDGVVLMPVFYAIEGKFKLQPLGIESKATKLYCFCKKHDEIFYPVDAKDAELSLKNLFLYAYRSFSGTYYKVLREIYAYDKLLKQYDFSENPIVEKRYIQIKNNIPILDICKNKFDNAVTFEQYDCMENISITLDYKAYVAAATCFCPYFDIFGNLIKHNSKELSLIYISILPHEDQTNIIFSWFKNDTQIYKNFKVQIETAPTRLILKYLNNLIPLNCENMVISPILWEKWGEKVRDEFLKFGYGGLKGIIEKDESKVYFSERKFNLFLRI